MEVNGIEGGLDAVIFNPIPSTILKWLMFSVQGWKQWFGIV
jgi:hypothetical protein